MVIEGTADIHANAQASSDSDESALVRDAKALDEGAWEEIFNGYYARLCTFLRYRVGDASAAEDLASQVLVEAVAGIDRYTYRGLPLGAWLFRIARNVSSDYLRREKRNAKAVAEASAEFEPPQPYESRGDDGQLMLALDQLTSEQRQVVVLRFFSELSTADTASAMGKSEGSIKALQHRALARMRKALIAGGSSA